MEVYNDSGDGVRHLKLNASGKRLDLPSCMLYSRSGMVPHLTEHNLNTVDNLNTFMQVPLATVYGQPGVDVMQKFAGTFHEFSSSQNKVLMLNTNDSYNSKPDIYKYSEEKSVSIWAPGGRRKITPEEYMKFIEVYSFDIAIAPSDPIPSGTTTKRCRKSIERTQQFLDKCLEIRAEKKLAVPLLGVVEGGDSIMYREKSAKYLATKNVDAYVLGGFNMITSNWKQLLQMCVSHLKADKAKMMFGVLTPLEVLEAVELGVDVFDSVIAYDASERGCALTFPFTNLHKYTVLRTEIQDGILSAEQPAKKPKVDNNGEVVNGDANGEVVRRDLSRFEIDLNNKKYFDDDQPLVEGCTCYCCTHHVRAYLHHLLVTKEMLASVLLMMHNLSYWFDFFKEIRRCEKEKKLHEMKDILTQIREASET